MSLWLSGVWSVCWTLSAQNQTSTMHNGLRKIILKVHLVAWIWYPCSSTPCSVCLWSFSVNTYSLVLYTTHTQNKYRTHSYKSLFDNCATLRWTFSLLEKMFYRFFPVVCFLSDMYYCWMHSSHTGQHIPRLCGAASAERWRTRAAQVHQEAKPGSRVWKTRRILEGNFRDCRSSASINIFRSLQLHWVSSDVTLQDKEAYLNVIHKYLDVHGTVDDSALIPGYVTNHGIVKGTEVQTLLRQSKVRVCQKNIFLVKLVFNREHKHPS